MAARPSNVRVFVHDTALISMNLPGGETWKWARRLANEVEIVAQAEAPKRTSRMANTMQVSVTPLGRDGVQGNVVAKVKYALWVHEGTGVVDGYIYPHGRWLKVQGGGQPTVFKRRVRGQQANPFLARALHIVFAANRL